MAPANQTQIMTKSPGQRQALQTTGGATQVPRPAVGLPADIQPVEAALTPANDRLHHRVEEPSET